MIKLLLLFCFLSLPIYASQDILLPLAARTASNFSADQSKTVEQKAHFIINVTVVPGTATITPIIEAKDYSGIYYIILQGAAISTTGVTILKVGPGVGALVSGATNDYLPDIYRIRFVHSAGSSFTYGVTINKGQ